MNLLLAQNPAHPDEAARLAQAVSLFQERYFAPDPQAVACGPMRVSRRGRHDQQFVILIQYDTEQVMYDRINEVLPDGEFMGYYLWPAASDQP